MLHDINFREIDEILEPSAGSGNILDYVNNKYSGWEYRDRAPKVDCIEPNKELRSVLKDKPCRIVHDNFLSFFTYKRYDLIAMNPPFSEGDKHLLKAIELCQFGGQIRCLLNAETIKNPYSQTRKDLKEKLRVLDAKVEFISDEFKKAEKKTSVEIAIIRIDIPNTDCQQRDILEKLKKSEPSSSSLDETKLNSDTLVYSDFIKMIISQYNFEIRLGIKLIQEFFSTSKQLTKYFEGEECYDNRLFRLHIGTDSNSGSVDNDKQAVNELVKSIRSKYWTTLFNSKNFHSIMTSKVRGEFMSKIESLSGYDFSEFNIEQIQQEISGQYVTTIETTILTLFDDLSRKHNWDNEDSKNIHYYSGWKTNKSWKINQKVIIPLYGAFHDWQGKFNPTNYQVLDKLTDIEKTLNYLAKNKNSHTDLTETLTQAKTEGRTGKIQCKYFRLTFYKKGTLHIEFTDIELLNKFNIFGSQKKGWLPPGFGKKEYGSMTKEEKTTVDDFCGQADYNTFYQEKDYYITNKIELLEDNSIK
jgi:hypothetical protein